MLGQFEPGLQELPSGPSTAPLNDDLPNFVHLLPPPSSFLDGSTGFRNDGKTLLHLAVLSQNCIQVKGLLSLHAPVNVQDSSGNYPLHYAARNGNLDIVSDLLGHGADIHAMGELESTPLHMAMRRVDVVRLLLKDGASLSIQDRDGNTPLHNVFLNFLDEPAGRQLYIANVLLDNNCDVNIQNKKGITPFLQLLDLPASKHPGYIDRHSFLDCVLKMLREGGNAVEPGLGGRSPIELFASRVKLIIDEEMSDIYSDDILQTLQAFLRNGASGWTYLWDRKPLVTWCFNRVAHLIRPSSSLVSLARTLCYGEKPNTIVNGTSVLHIVAETCGKAQALEFLEILFQNGADPNCKDGDGMTPLMLALETRLVTQEAKDFILALVKNGADPWIFEPTGNCAFYEVFRNFSKVSITFIADILVCDIFNREQRNSGVLNTENTRTIASRSPEWAEALTARTWSEGLQAWTHHRNTLPAGIDPDMLMHTARFVLAETHLRLARVWFDEPEQELGYVLKIFRDCRAHGIALNPKHYERLLDICP